MSSSRLCVRISNCSRLFLATWGERLSVNFSMQVGSGIGPRTWAPVRFAVFTISRVDVSRIRWSNALSRMRMFWPFIAVVSFFVAFGEQRVADSDCHWSPRYPPIPIRVFDDGGDDAGADGAAAFADREAQLFFH